MTNFLKDRRHDHYWISEQQLYESYSTIRGLRYRHIMEVPGMSDTDKCSQDLINIIENKFCNK